MTTIYARTATTLSTRIVFALLIIVVSFVDNYFVQGYTCETPAEWLEVEVDTAADNSTLLSQPQPLSRQQQLILGNESVQAANFRHYHRHGRKWPDGLVKYKLDASLSAGDITTLRSAFDEYHRKTCIRFQPRAETDIGYVSIEIEDGFSGCGYAHVCMLGVYQFARFGKTCRPHFKQVMIHELGHVLCLDHEQTRADRDDWVSFDRCSEIEMRLNKNEKRSNLLNGMYDYSSQMHYECDSCSGGFPKNGRVKKCGAQVTKGLSLLDADNINSMYNCQGCFKHRWRTLQFLTVQDRKHMYSFGFTDIHGYPIFPCRAFFQGEIVIGKYSHQQRKCVISWGGEEHAVFKNVEVLTIPGGLEQKNSNGSGVAVVTHRYELASIRSISMGQVVQVGIPAGRTMESDAGLDWEGVGYIAFGTVKIPDEEGGTLLEESIGTVWRRKWDDYPIASFAASGKEHVLADNYKLLVCNQL